MAAPGLVLRGPREDEEKEVLRAHRETSPTYPTFLHDYADGMSFRQYLDLLAAHRRGESLPPDRVPETFLFAFVGSDIVGRVSIRHTLNPFLERVGGHIGYAVVPRFRRRGYATEILRQALAIAREQLGLDRVLLTCNDDNIGSIRVIERNGGVFESLLDGPDPATPKRRYWIATTAAG